MNQKDQTARQPAPQGGERKGSNTMKSNPTQNRTIRFLASAFAVAIVGAVLAPAAAYASTASNTVLGESVGRPPRRARL